MTHILRIVAPAFIVLSLALPVKSAFACDDKHCSHHKDAAACDCSCGDKAHGKDHKCGTQECKKAKCDGKECSHKHEHHEHTEQKT